MLGKERIRGREREVQKEAGRSGALRGRRSVGRQGSWQPKARLRRMTKKKQKPKQFVFRHGPFHSPERRTVKSGRPAALPNPAIFIVAERGRGAKSRRGSVTRKTETWRKKKACGGASPCRTRPLVYLPSISVAIGALCLSKSRV